MDISGKIAVVTGGTKGIGLGIAESLLKEKAKVFICGRNPDDLQTAISQLKEFGEIDGAVCDARDESSVKAMLETAEQKFGGIDVLINNAGIGIFAPVADLKPDDFRAVLETNLFGVFYACHYAIPKLKSRGGGYIINISSLAGTNAHPKMSAYNASKFGLNGFSEAMMQEVRHDNIKVSYIMPGSVNTDFGGSPASDANTHLIQPEDIGEIVVNLLKMNERTLPSRVEVRPSKPAQK